MCYKCNRCGETVPQGTQRMTVIVNRQVPSKDYFGREQVYPNGKPVLRNEIAKEIAVCEECYLKSLGRKSRGEPIETLPYVSPYSPKQYSNTKYADSL